VNVNDDEGTRPKARGGMAPVDDVMEETEQQPQPERKWNKYDTEELILSRLIAIYNKVEERIRENGGEIITPEQFRDAYLNDLVKGVLNGIDFQKNKTASPGCNTFYCRPVYIKENGHMYWGNWGLNGKKNGWGVLKTENSCYYEGWFIDDILNGEVLVIDEKGDYYLREYLLPRASLYKIQNLQDGRSVIPSQSMHQPSGSKRLGHPQNMHP